MLLDWTLIFCLQVQYPKWSPSFILNLPTKYTTSFNQGAWPCETSQGKSGPWQSSMAVQELNQAASGPIPGLIHWSLALGVWERAEACSRCPYSKVTEGWGVKAEALEKKKSCLTLEVRATWRWHLSLHSQLESVHLITRWGYNMYLLRHISTEEGRIRINWAHLY